MSLHEGPPRVTAHRGSSAEAPENTLAALRLAVEDGADACELDVFQAGDGTLVVTHDPTFERLAGVDLAVREATADRIAELDAGAWFGEAFRGEPVPTLDQVLDAARGRIRLNLELKTHGHERGYAEAVVGALRRHRVASTCILTSLDAALLAQVRAADPSLVLGMILSLATGREAALDVDLYSVEQGVADAAFVARAHADGRAVHVWTVNERAAMERLVALGVDDLITDHPRLAREVVDALASGAPRRPSLRP